MQIFSHREFAGLGEWWPDNWEFVDRFRMVSLRLQPGAGDGREPAVAALRTLRGRSERQGDARSGESEVQRIRIRNDDQLRRGAVGHHRPQRIPDRRPGAPGLLQEDEGLRSGGHPHHHGHSDALDAGELQGGTGQGERGALLGEHTQAGIGDFSHSLSALGMIQRESERRRRGGVG